MTEPRDRVRKLSVSIDGAYSGELSRESSYTFAYARDDARQPAVSLLMLPRQLVYTDGDLFPSMDMNLPEGFLYERIRDMLAKREISKMQLLSLIGTNGIGRVGFAVDGAASPTPAPITKAQILESSSDGAFFQQLVDAYLSTGLGISGVQPKVMVPTRSTTPIPNLIVKSAGELFAHLAGNEFLCMSAARRAGISVPSFDLSQDGTILVLDRFDVDERDRRLGFEDIAALMALRVHDRLSNRKYRGSYEAIADVIRLVSSEPALDLAAFYEQLSLSVMVRNGDAHLKNFGMLYTGPDDVRLSPMFDVVTTSIYRFERPGGIESTDRTLALRWRKGKHYASKAYPSTEELLEFGRQVCQVAEPCDVIERIADAMGQTLAAAQSEARISAALVGPLSDQWELGMAYAREGAEMRRRASTRPRRSGG